MPEDTNALLRELHSEIVALRSAVADLAQVQQRQADMQQELAVAQVSADVSLYRHKRLVRVVVGLVVVVTLALSAGLYGIYDEGSHRQDQISRLACLLIAGTPDKGAPPIVGQFRRIYDCPPFNPKDAQQFQTPAPSRTGTHTGTRSPSPSGT